MIYFNKLNLIYNRIIGKVSKYFESVFVSYICIITYKALLDFIYCSYIGNAYAYFNLKISAMNIVNGWLIVILMPFVINKFYRQKTCSAIIMIALNLIYFIPITTYCSYGGGSSSFLFFAIIYWVLMSVLQIRIPTVLYKKNSTEVSNKILYISVMIISAFSLYIWWKYTGFRIQTDILNVYDIRSEAAQYSLPVLLNYARHISTIIVPMLILLTMQKKKYILLILLIFITLINFSYAGNKSIILFPIILIGGYILYRKEFISWFFPIGILLEILAIIEQKCGSILINSFVFRRQGLVLAQLSEDYYRFFLENPIDLFRNSVMGKFGFDSIYSQTLAKVIGNNFESQVVNCNNGLLADVWSGFGLVGLIIMPFIMIICFRLLDFVSYGVNQRLTIGLVLYYAIMFANSTWSTVLLTHGFLVICLIFFIFPRDDNKIGAIYEDN